MGRPAYNRRMHEVFEHTADLGLRIVAPTLDLVGQWYDQLTRAFGKPVGVLGGGHHELEAITVATYDSAWMAEEDTVDALSELLPEQP
jgi:superfamily II DNA or RNA helicase